MNSSYYDQFFQVLTNYSYKFWCIILVLYFLFSVYYRFCVQSIKWWFISQCNSVTLYLLYHTSVTFCHGLCTTLIGFNFYVPVWLKSVVVEYCFIVYQSKGVLVEYCFIVYQSWVCYIRTSYISYITYLTCNIFFWHLSSGNELNPNTICYSLCSAVLFYRN